MLDLSHEEKFFDQQGKEMLENKNSLIVKDPHDFLAGTTVAFNYFMDLLGDVSDKKILDYGCGSGWLATYLAQKGAQVHGFDISSKLIDVGIKRARENGVGQQVILKKMSAEDLDYPDDFFDLVVGISILHHVDYNLAGQELKRVMKNGSRALFIEPLGENILLNFIRDFVEQKIRGVRTEDEHPLRYQDLNILRNYFNDLLCREFQLLGTLERLIGNKKAKRLKLDVIDNFILRRFSFLKKLCRVVVISLGK